MIILDTSVLIDSLTGDKRSHPTLRRFIENHELILVPSLVLFEWLRGPRSQAEIAAQEALFPLSNCLVFGAREAFLSAQIYRSLSHPRGREIDIGIAASAIMRDANLWTLNTADFQDIPNLRLANTR